MDISPNKVLARDVIDQIQNAKDFQYQYTEMIIWKVQNSMMLFMDSP